MQDLPEARSKWQALRHAWPLLAIACLGIAVAVSAFIAVWVWEDRLAKTKFDNVASDYATALQTGLNEYLDKIRAVRAFYDASEGVDATEFQRFTRQILEGYGNTMRVVWCPRVSGEERADFELEAKKSGLTNFTIKTWAMSGRVFDSPIRMEYFPILYSTVSHARTATHGVDLQSERVRGQAIRRARDEDAMATAQGIQLRNPIGGERRGFIAFLPVYRQGLPHDSVVTRRRNLEGVVAGAFQTGTVFNTILDKATLPRNVDIYIYPASSGAGAPPVYERVTSFDEAPDPVTRASLGSRPYWASLPLKAGDATWDLVVTPADWGLTSHYRAWLVAALVLLVFGAVLTYMWASLRHALRLESANRRILELAQTDPPHHARQPRLYEAAQHGLRGEPARRSALCGALPRCG